MLVDDYRLMCHVFFYTMRARNFAVTFDCSVFWSGVVEKELLCRQDVFPFIKRCHTMTLETSVCGVLTVHARTCLFSELFDDVSIVAFHLDDLHLIPLDFDVSRSPMRHKV